MNRMRRTWYKRRICVRFGPSGDFVAQMVGLGCSLSCETLLYPAKKESDGRSYNSF